MGCMNLKQCTFEHDYTPRVTDIKVRIFNQCTAFSNHFNFFKYLKQFPKFGIVENHRPNETLLWKIFWKKQEFKWKNVKMKVDNFLSQIATACIIPS